MNSIKELIEHMKKYKDTVFIVGPGAAIEPKQINVEEYNENFSRKALKREPDKLWEYFFNNIYTEPQSFNKSYLLLENLLRQNNCKVILQNTDGFLVWNDVIYLHGSDKIFTCQKCKTIYTVDYVKTDNGVITECEQCDGKLKPNTLLAGEKYDQVCYDLMKDWVEKTHTLFLVGLDYTEEPLLDLIAQYGDIKAQVNAAGQEERAIVSVQSEEETFDPNELTYCEFLVKGDVNSAMDRFSKEFF